MYCPLCKEEAFPVYFDNNNRKYRCMNCDYVDVESKFLSLYDEEAYENNEEKDEKEFRRLFEKLSYSNPLFVNNLIGKYLPMLIYNIYSIMDEDKDKLINKNIDT